MRQFFNRTKGNNKYGAEKVEYDGITFDSKVEGERYLYLKTLLLAGEISDLETHKTYELVPKQTTKEIVHLKTKDKEVERTLFHPVVFTPDFVYTTKDGELVCEDVKGSTMLVSADFPLRRKLLYYRYGIYCRLVTYTKKRGWEIHK